VLPSTEQRGPDAATTRKRDHVQRREFTGVRQCPSQRFLAAAVEEHDARADDGRRGLAAVEPRAEVDAATRRLHRQVPFVDRHLDVGEVDGQRGEVLRRERPYRQAHPTFTSGA
jgi:hypothetical protein